MKRFVALLVTLGLAGCGGSGTGSPFAAPQENVANGPAIKPLAANTEFYASGRKLLFKNGGQAKTFYIKGVDYAPTPICSGPLESPLAEQNRTIWSRDLPELRDLGINAIKIYNSHPGADLSAFLNAAYNGGDHPIYVILSIFFNGDKPLDHNAVLSLKQQYQTLAENNASFPAVMGISIGSEINSEEYIGNAQWWKGLNEIAAGARQGFAKTGVRKIITTSLVDDGLATVREGEKNNYNIDAWGINVYRGATWGLLWSQAKQYTTKPFMLGEWGAPESYHPNGNPNRAEEWPTGQLATLRQFFKGLETSGYDNSTIKGGVGSGGFLFEWSDEWWKADEDNKRGGFCKQLPNGIPNGNFPGGFFDHAWFGLNSIAKGTPNVLTQRPVLKAMKNTWASEESEGSL